MSADLNSISSDIERLQGIQQELLKTIEAWNQNIERFNWAKKKFSEQNKLNEQCLAELECSRPSQDEAEQLAREQQQNNLLKELNRNKGVIEHYTVGILNLEEHKSKAQAELTKVEAIMEELEKNISNLTDTREPLLEKRISFGM